MKEKEDVERAREIGGALGKEVIPFGLLKNTGKAQQLREKADKAYKQHGKGSYAGRKSQVFGSLRGGPSTSPSPSTSTTGEGFVSNQDLATVRTIAKETEEDLEGRENRKGRGKGQVDTVSVTVY